MSVRKKIGIVATLAFCALLPLLMAPTGGFPSRPRFQALTVAGTSTFEGPAVFQDNSTHWTGTVPQFGLRESDAGPDEKNWLVRANNGRLAINTAADATPTSAGSGNPAITIDRTGTTVDEIHLQATSVRVNGEPLLLATQSGTLTAGIPDCSGGPSVAVQATRVGHLLVVDLASLTCSSGTTTLSLCCLNPELRPSSTVVAGPIVTPNTGVTGAPLNDLRWLNSGTLDSADHAVDLTSTGTLRFYRNGALNNWAASSTKGWQLPARLYFHLN